MLYIFAGFPKSGLHAGGLQYCIETVENLAIIEHDPAVQYRKEGVFAAGTDEELYPLEVVMSPMLERDGITLDWFPENWSFGNGITISKTMASPTIKTVVHGTELSMEEFLDEYGGTSEGLVYERKHIRHESWQEYEARWTLGKCPQKAHLVHLVSVVTSHNLPEFAYNRIRDIIERDAPLLRPEVYSTEPGHHFSEVRKYEGIASHN